VSVVIGVSGQGPSQAGSIVCDSVLLARLAANFGWLWCENRKNKPFVASVSSCGYDG